MTNMKTYDEFIKEGGIKRIGPHRIPRKPGMPVKPVNPLPKPKPNSKQPVFQDKLNG
jgi:hypothetical protein